MNKRGDISIVVLVFLVLIVCIATIFSFLVSGGKINTQVGNTRLVENVYSEQYFVEYYLSESMKLALVKTYEEFANSKDYIANPIIDSDGNYEFKDLHAKLKENFIDKFKINLNEEISKYNFEEKSLINFKDRVSSGNYDAEFDGEKIRIILKDFEIKKDFKKFSVNYIFNLTREVEFGKVNLDGFGEIYTIKEKCKNEGDILLLF